MLPRGSRISTILSTSTIGSSSRSTIARTSGSTTWPLSGLVPGSSPISGWVPGSSCRTTSTC